MKPQFGHKLSSSFTLFLEHNLLQKGEAFTNTTGTFYSSDQNNIDGINNSNSSATQWVYDSSISGAIVPSGVYLDSAFVPRGTSGVSLDFFYGGAYHSGNFEVSGAYAKKDFNFYFRPERDTELLVETAMSAKDPLGMLTGSNKFKISAPCIIVNQKDSKNEAFAFGGYDETETFFQAVVITDNNYLLDGALSIFRDLNETCFPVIDFEDVPWTAKFDLKDGEFNYTGLYLQYPENSQRATIDRVIANQARQTSMGRGNFYIGYCEFRVLNYRFPRSDGPRYVQYSGEYVVYP